MDGDQHRYVDDVDHGDERFGGGSPRATVVIYVFIDWRLFAFTTVRVCIYSKVAIM